MVFTKYKKQLKVLALGAHPDDVEIGCGGFLSKLRREFDAEVYIGIMTYGKPYAGDPIDGRAKEAIEAAQVLLGYDCTEIEKKIRFGFQKDCELHKNIHELVRIIEHWLKEIEPDLLLTHDSGDLHHDHEEVFRATISAARDFHGDILVYQAPSTIPNEFSPNFFVEINEEDFERKVSAINKHSSQYGKRFVEQGYSARISQAWAAFHRLPPQKQLEAFKIYKSFLIS